MNETRFYTPVTTGPIDSMIMESLYNNIMKPTGHPERRWGTDRTLIGEYYTIPLHCRLHDMVDYCIRIGNAAQRVLSILDFKLSITHTPDGGTACQLAGDRHISTFDVSFIPLEQRGAYCIGFSITSTSRMLDNSSFLSGIRYVLSSHFTRIRKSYLSMQSLRYNSSKHLGDGSAALRISKDHFESMDAFFGQLTEDLGLLNPPAIKYPEWLNVLIKDNFSLYCKCSGVFKQAAVGLFHHLGKNLVIALGQLLSDENSISGVFSNPVPQSNRTQLRVHPMETIQCKVLPIIMKTISFEEFAEALDVEPQSLADKIDKRSPISADLSIKLGEFFNHSPEFWLCLQRRWDIKTKSTPN